MEDAEKRARRWDIYKAEKKAPKRENTLRGSVVGRLGTWIPDCYDEAGPTKTQIVRSPSTTGGVQTFSNTARP